MVKQPLEDETPQQAINDACRVLYRTPPIFERKPQHGVGGGKQSRFVRALSKRERLNAVRVARIERGIWQRRFREHLIHDEADRAQSAQARPRHLRARLAVLFVSSRRARGIIFA